MAAVPRGEATKAATEEELDYVSIYAQRVFEHGPPKTVGIITLIFFWLAVIGDGGSSHRRVP